MNSKSMAPMILAVGSLFNQPKIKKKNTTHTKKHTEI